MRCADASAIIPGPERSEGAFGAPPPNDGVWTCCSRRPHAERIRAGEKPRPRALRQGDAVAHSLAQDAVAAFSGKVDALDTVSGRKRRNQPCQAIRFAEDALAITERRQIDRNGNAVEIWRIKLPAGGKRRRDDRVAGHQAAEALDHERETGAFRTPERQQRREFFRIGRLASLCVKSPAERNVAP